MPQIAFKASFFVMPLQFLGCILKNYLDIELLTKFEKHVTDTGIGSVRLNNYRHVL